MTVLESLIAIVLVEWERAIPARVDIEGDGAPGFSAVYCSSGPTGSISLDDLLAWLRRLTPEKLGRVTRVLDALEAEDSPATGFERLCGLVTAPDADAMRTAIAECEQVEGEW